MRRNNPLHIRKGHVMTCRLRSKGIKERSMKILITGVAGLLGARLADYVVDTIPHVTVVGVDNLSGGFAENVDNRVIFHQMDLVEDDLEPTI